MPEQPILISFDDTHKEHFSIAAPLLELYRSRAVLLVMTVAIGKPGYMIAAEIKALSDRGHVIACRIVKKISKAGFLTSQDQE